LNTKKRKGERDTEALHRRRGASAANNGRRLEIPCDGLHERGEDAGHARARERGARGRKLGFYREREGEGVATEANWPLMDMAADPVLMALKGTGEGEEE
jgi:hypothetical protein